MAKIEDYKKKITRAYLVQTLKDFLVALNIKEIGDTDALKTEGVVLVDALNEVFEKVMASSKVVQCDFNTFVSQYQHAGLESEDTPAQPFIAFITEEFTFEDNKYPELSFIYGVDRVADPGDPGKYTFDWKVMPNASMLIGDLEDLTTNIKDTLVLAINELDEKQGDEEITVKNTEGEVIPTISQAVNRVDDKVGELDDLTTDTNANIVAAVNELDARVGKLDGLTVEDKASIVAAINHIVAFIGDFSALITTENDTLINGVNSNKKEIGILNGLDPDIKEVDLVATANTVFDKSKVSIDEDTTQARYSNVFTVKQNDNTLAVIKVPKDYYLSDAVLYKSTGEEIDPQGFRIKDTEGNNLVKDSHYIKIVIAQSSDIMYVNVEDLYNEFIPEENAIKIQLKLDDTTQVLSADIVAHSITKDDLQEELGKAIDFTGWANLDKPLDTEAQNLRGGVNELKELYDKIREEFGKILDIDLPDEVTNATQAIQYLLTKKLGYIGSTTYANWNTTIRNVAKAGTMYVITDDFKDVTFDSEATYKAGTWLYCINGSTHTWVAMNNGGGGIDTLITEVDALPLLSDAKSNTIYVVTDGDTKKAYLKLDNANQWLLLNGGSSEGGTWLGNAYYYEADHTGVKWEVFFALAGQQFLNDAAMSLKGSSASESDVISIYTNNEKPATGDDGTYFGQYIFKDNKWEAYSQQTKATKNVFGVTKLATDDEFIAKSTEYPVTPDQVLGALDNYALKDNVYTKVEIDGFKNEYYTKSETYTKVEIEGLIASIRQVKHVSSEAEMRADKKAGTLYYVGTTSPYQQWLCISSTEFLNLGDSEIDLDGYYKEQEGVTNQCIATLKNIRLDKTIQEQLDSKMSEITGAASTIVEDNLDKGKVVISNSFTGKIDVSDTTASELSQLKGIDTTQTVQKQLDNKQALLKNQENIKSINNVPVIGVGNMELQEPLVSGTNIKTINNESILGSGNIDILKKEILKTIDGKSILITTPGDTDIETIEDVTKITNTLEDNRVYHLIKEQGGYQIGGYYIRNKYTDAEGNPQDEWVRLDNVVRADTITTVSSLVAVGAPLNSTIYRLKSDDGTYKAGYYIYYKNDAAGDQDMGTGYICISKDENSLQAGTGLEITAQGVINHKNAIAEGSLHQPNYSGGISAPYVKYDTEGHIKEVVEERNIYAPTTPGDPGQMLVSGGFGTETEKRAPTWTSAGINWYGTCGTGASTQAKEVACSGFVLGKGHVIAVKFTEANSIATPTLNVNNTGAKTIYWGNEAITANNGWAANDTLTLMYDGVYYRVLSVDKPECLWGTCGTAATTAAKTVTVPGFHLHKGATVNVSFTYPHISGTAATLNVNNTGAKTIRRYGLNVTTNNGTSWCANDLITLVYDGTYWQLTDSSNVAVGTICMFGGANIPAGWLYCNGGAISRTTYDKLYAVIGTNFGVGDGSSTFNLPDFRQRFPEGAGSASLTNAESYNLGTKVAAGIPDIYGYENQGGKGDGAGSGNWYGDYRASSHAGAFTGVTSAGVNMPYTAISSGNRPIARTNFRASSGEVPNTTSTTVKNLVYGKNKGVQPNALAVHFMIRYL